MKSESILSNFYELIDSLQKEMNDINEIISNKNKEWLLKDEFESLKKLYNNKQFNIKQDIKDYISTFQIIYLSIYIKYISYKFQFINNDKIDENDEQEIRMLDNFIKNYLEIIKFLNENKYEIIKLFNDNKSDSSINSQNLNEFVNEYGLKLLSTSDSHNNDSHYYNYNNDNNEFKNNKQSVFKNSYNHMNKFKDSKQDLFKNYNSKKQILLYIYKKNCMFCQNFEIIWNEVSKFKIHTNFKFIKYTYIEFQSSIYNQIIDHNSIKSVPFLLLLQYDINDNIQSMVTMNTNNYYLNNINNINKDDFNSKVNILKTDIYKIIN